MWRISISQVLEFLMRPHSLPLEEIMDDYFLTFMCLIPMFFGAWAVRSIIDDIKRGKQ